MSDIKMPDCEVCRKNTSIAVVAGSGPYSYAVCRQCVGFEPYGWLIAYLFTIPWEDINPEFQKYVEACCIHQGKTIEQFKEECAIERRRLEEHGSN